MDFDDLDDAAGPDLEELRKELLAKQVPHEMPGAKRHPKPMDKGYGGGNFKSQKVLFLHGPGSTAKLCERQVSAMFKNVPWVVDFKIFEWHYWEGKIVNKVWEIHADPAVQEVFNPYGPDFFSYFVQERLNCNDESWEPLDEVVDQLAEKLKADGPFDGLCGFDMGGGLAFTAARLAQEGDTRFEKMFRYLMLFSTHGHKELAQKNQGALRPKAPLMIPCFMGWSLFDDGRCYPAYEDLCLYIHPDYRGVIKHDQGHRPPNIQKGTPACEELNAFVEAMQADCKYKPTGSAENQVYKDYWLPLVRSPGTELEAEEPKRILVVVPDPMGEHGPEAGEAMDRARFPAQESPYNCFLRLGARRAVTGAQASDFQAFLDGDGADGPPIEIMEVTYSDEIRALPWLPKEEQRDVSVAYAAGQGRSRWVQVEDEVQVPWEHLRRVADAMLSGLEVGRGDNVAIVGVGTGGLLAVALAEAIIRSKAIIPIGLWAAFPPTVWPVTDAPPMGALITTPVRYFTTDTAISAPPWRLETCTFGPFSSGFIKVEGVTDAKVETGKEVVDWPLAKKEMVKMVITELKALGK